MTEITDGLPAPVKTSGVAPICLVTGANGYIGGRLIRELLTFGYRVRVLARNASRLTQYPWIDQVEVVEGDAHDEKSLERALAGIDVAYYLIHSLLVKDDFEASELKMAKMFADAASDAKVSRIIYLGGIINGTDDLSDHMSARMNTEQYLPNRVFQQSNFELG